MKGVKQIERARNEKKELETKNAKLFEAAKMSSSLLIYLVNATAGVTLDDTVGDVMEKIDRVSSALIEESDDWDNFFKKK